LAKPFRSNLQPVEIGRRLTREMDLHRRVGVRGLIAPNAFVGDALGRRRVEPGSRISSTPSARALRCRPRARPAEGYSFVGPVEVEIFEGSNRQGGAVHGRPPMSHEGADGGFLAELVLPDGAGSLSAREPWSSAAFPSARGPARTPTSAVATPRSDAEGRRRGRHRPRLDQRDPGQRRPGSRTGPRQRGRGQRRVDETHLRDVVSGTRCGGVPARHAEPECGPPRPAVGGHRAHLPVLPARHPGRLGRDEPGHHPQALKRRSVGEARAATPLPNVGKIDPRRPQASAPPQGGRATRPRRPRLRPRRRADRSGARRAAASPSPDDIYTSTLHARLFRRNDQLWVEDLGSTNGTFVNSEQISSAPRSKRVTCSRSAAPSSRKSE
jgi:hypothetical protein